MKTTSGAAVAVVTPIHAAERSPAEELSIRHLESFLGRYDRYFFAPRSLTPKRPGFEVVPFPDRFFRSIACYSRLLLSADFYRAFRHYEYILVYQLDCLVFSDSLLDFCRAGYDYVGAPWLVEPQEPVRGFSRVGNGGLSLRRVRSCLRVLESPRYIGRRIPFLWDLFRAPLPDLAGGELYPSLLKRLRVLREVRRGCEWYTSRYTLNEDRFWSDRARIFLPSFRIAPVREGLRFSFERAPRYCFERNGRRLPFGCHAWKRWDPRFWEPYELR